MLAKHCDKKTNLWCPCQIPHLSDVELKKLLQKIWMTRGPLAWALTPLAALHLMLVMLRKKAYQWHILKTVFFPVPVIVVGNVVVGGAGKTPLVIELASHFQRKGFQIGVVSRGYGRHSHRALEVETGMPADLSGDEPAFIKARAKVPVFVAKRRINAIQMLLQAYPQTEIIICDDGLQHYELHRDVEIAVFDDRGIGNGWLLPAGLLREPWPQRQKHGVHLVLHTGQAPQFSGYVSTRQLGPRVMAANGEQVPLAFFHNKRVSAVAAIANPSAFFNMLRAAGVVLTRAIGLPDHYSFPTGLAELDANLADEDAVLCTEKDAVKLFHDVEKAPKNLFSVSLVFTAEPAFYDALDELIAPLTRPKHSQVPFGNGY